MFMKPRVINNGKLTFGIDKQKENKY